MRSSHYYRFTWLIVLLLVANNCCAVAVPKYNGRMNNAVSEVIKTKLHKQYPFAANDPRFNATVSAIGSGVTTLVGGAIVGTTWPALLLATGISAMLGYAVPLVMDKGIEWIFKDNGEIEYTVGQNIPSGEINIDHIPKLGSNILENLPVNQVIYFRHGVDMYKYLARPFPKGIWTTQSGVFYGPSKTLGNGWSFCGLINNNSAILLMDESFSSKPNNRIHSVSINIPSPTVTSNPVDVAIDDIPEELLDKKLSPGMLAVATNAVWRAAAAGGHSGGISWSADDPVTEQDVQEWLDTYPEEAPTVGDFIAPVASPAAAAFSLTANNSNPLPSTSTARATETAINSDTAVAQNPEPNPDPQPDPEPDVGEPELENIPTAEMILAPLLNLMSDLKNFSVPSHVTVCPVSSFTALGKEYQLRTHCDLIEQHRVVIESAMALAWAITALFIVLKA